MCVKAMMDTDLNLPVSVINPLLTCDVCKGYFVEATTITECLHTFCKSCIVKHVELSLHCPTCDGLIHPSNPFSNLKLDSTKQDIVHKLFPHIAKDEEKREIEFYKSHNLPLPGKGGSKNPCAIVQIKKKLSRLQRQVAWTSLLLEYAGAPKYIGKFQPLLKKYLRVPVSTTIEHLQKYVTKKMHLGFKYRAVIIVQSSLVHESLSLEAIRAVFFPAKPVQSMLRLYYGVLPSDFAFEEPETVAPPTQYMP